LFYCNLKFYTSIKNTHYLNILYENTWYN